MESVNYKNFINHIHMPENHNDDNVHTFQTIDITVDGGGTRFDKGATFVLALPAKELTKCDIKKINSLKLPFIDDQEQTLHIFELKDMCWTGSTQPSRMPTVYDKDDFCVLEKIFT